ncbi:MAG: rod shape-determining protein MreC [Myxococcales bacterium]|nr:rod shape-determining protein MreC [Myxococcales bacterium]MDH5305686.1 rod shape-determining protein MreC [Myxococcales bacterium]MDH5566831.1 rod shape-determining protein MreC [Myxococcales bacterium]
MTEYRSRVFIAFLVVGLVGFSLVNMVVDRRALGAGDQELSWWSGLLLDAAVPVQKTIAVPFDLIRGTWWNYVALQDVRDENAALRSKLAAVEDENLQLREALVASGRLALVDEMTDAFDVPMRPAELVGLDVSAWFRSALIDCGRSCGVHAGMPVVSPEHFGLVGLVTTTSLRAAKVMLLIDRQSAVDGLVQRSRARGVVRGGKKALEFEFVARGGDVQVGDEIITSGLGGVYPKGFRIGQVTALSAPDARLLQTATVEPAVDFGRLEQVYVMLRRGPTMELLYSTQDGDAPESAEPPSS